MEKKITSHEVVEIIHENHVHKLPTAVGTLHILVQLQDTRIEIAFSLSLSLFIYKMAMTALSSETI